METIKIAKDEAMVDDAQKYVDVLNGIVYSCCQQDGFTEGSRNKVAVDLTVAAYMLGLDPELLLRKLIDTKVIDPSKDDEDTFKRVRHVMWYTNRFDWDYMIDPDDYFTLGTENDGTEVPVKFVLS